jgi:hypothetical protein
MPKGFGILAGLFGGVPLFVWLHFHDLVGQIALSDYILSFMICVGFTYGVGWITGYAIKTISRG